MADTAAERLDEIINEPASASRPDGTSASNQSIQDLIALDKHKAADAAGEGANAQRSAWAMTRPARSVPPGATG